MFFLKSLNRLGITIILLIIVSLAVPLAGFLATDWTGSTFTLPSRILARLEQFIPAISRFSAGGGIHVNTLGGTLTFFIPLLLSMLWEAKVIKRTYLQDFTHRNLVMILTKSVLIISLLLSSIILVLTQSRGSYLGVISGVLVYIIWKNPRVYWLIPFLVVILISVFLVFGNGNIQQFISLLDTSVEGDTVQVRLDYWKRTVFLIQDFPFTGVGLGTYGKVFDELYPFTQIAANSNIAFYAHNMYLAVAASMGLPALVLYCAIFSAIISMVISSYRKVRSVVRMLLMGLSCGILANLVYGLWDNYLLGENLAIVLWIYLGVITALYIHQNKMNRRSRADSKERIDPEMNVRKRINKKLVFDVFLNTSTWILLSLTAIAFININPYISLTIAMLGGILLGILLTKRHEKNFQSIESFHSASASTT